MRILITTYHLPEIEFVSTHVCRLLCLVRTGSSTEAGIAITTKMGQNRFCVAVTRAFWVSIKLSLDNQNEYDEERCTLRVNV